MNRDDWFRTEGENDPWPIDWQALQRNANSFTSKFFLFCNLTKCTWDVLLFAGRFMGQVNMVQSHHRHLAECTNTRGPWLKSITMFIGGGDIINMSNSQHYQTHHSLFYPCPVHHSNQNHTVTRWRWWTFPQAFSLDPVTWISANNWNWPADRQSTDQNQCSGWWEERERVLQG